MQVVLIQMFKKSNLLEQKLKNLKMLRDKFLGSLKIYKLSWQSTCLISLNGSNSMKMKKLNASRAKGIRKKEKTNEGIGFKRRLY